MIGQTISHYKEVIDEISKGGMGVVYKAQDLKLDRMVAVKFLPAHSYCVARQQGEIPSGGEGKTAAMNHPNILNVYEVDEQDDGMFLVMGKFEEKDTEFMRGRISTPEPAFLSPQAIEWASQIAEE